MKDFFSTLYSLADETIADSSGLLVNPTAPSHKTSSTLPEAFSSCPVTLLELSLTSFVLSVTLSVTLLVLSATSFVISLALLLFPVFWLQLLKRSCYVHTAN